MHTHEALLTRFYTAFQQGDFKTMGACYHDEATFRDEAFDLKTAAEVRAMWEMLISRGKDMNVTFDSVKADEKDGSAHWDAYYTFSSTGRKVHNSVHSGFEFKDGLIVKQVDSFSFYRWSRQSLGTTGLLLGWTGFLQNKVRKTAMGNLKEYMQKRGL